MSFIQLKDIPFKKLPHSYVADLGDIRILVNDTSLLVEDNYIHINPVSGVQQNFEYYLKLPIKATLNDVGSSGKLFELVADTKSVLNICQQQSDYSGSVGVIGQVIKDSRSTHRDIIYSIKQRGSLGGNSLSTLSGIICIDSFTEIPSYFVTKVNGNVIINEISYDDSEIKTLRTRILSEVDNKTNELIMYGFIYTGLKVRLTIEDQINFEGEFNLIKDFMSTGITEDNFFPLKYKVWTNEDGSPVFMTLANLNELRDFLFKGKTYIRDCLAAGWVIKNAVIVMTLDELITWKDSRIEE